MPDIDCWRKLIDVTQTRASNSLEDERYRGNEQLRTKYKSLCMSTNIYNDGELTSSV